jgi:hypothetical protein
MVRNGYIGILPSSPSYLGGETEDFSTSTFPVFPGNPDKGWDVKGLTVPTWKRSTTAFVSSPACLSISNSASVSGNVHTLISPVFEVAGPLTDVKIGFKYAYARRTTSNTDKLVISYSTNCGKTWFQGFNKTGSILATVPNTVSGTFVPTASQWKQDFANISFLSGNSQFRLKFEFTAGGGNNIYIDDVQLITVTGVSNLQDDELALNLYPNPSQTLPVIEIRNSRADRAKVEIVDAIGRSIIWRKELNLEPGKTEVFLGNEFTAVKAGIYWVRLQVSDRVMVRQMQILP